MRVDDFPAPGNPDRLPLALASPFAGVALWSAELATQESEVARVSAWLSAEEHARAARFGRPALAHRYIAGRALLRWLLARTLAVTPPAVRISRGARGRPQLADAAGIDFNVSHTQGIALIGITHHCRIGVDIERDDRKLRADGLAQKFLTAAEQATLAPLPATERRQRFLRYWTCKEAMSKATGDGLSAPFRQIEVALEDRFELVRGPDPYRPERWQLARVEVPAGLLATVALWSQ